MKLVTLEQLQTNLLALVDQISSLMASGSAIGHEGLINRSNPDQHPIAAITGLQEALDGKQASGDYVSMDALNEQITALQGSFQPTLSQGDVETDLIADGAIIEAKIAKGAVTTEKIGNAAVGAAQLAEASISLDKLAQALILPVEQGGTGASEGAAALENLFASGATILSANQYGDELPSAGTAGRLFLKRKV